MPQSPEPIEFTTIDLGPGAQLHHAPVQRFKTLLIQAFIRFDLEPVDSTRLAMLRALLRRGTQRLPSQREITRFLERLYGASFGVDLAKVGESHVLTLHLETISDCYVSDSDSADRRDSPFHQGLSFLRDVLAAPALDAEGGFARDVVEQERSNLRRLIEGLVDDRETYAAEQCNRIMCRDEPYALYEYGDTADLPGLGGRDLADYLATAMQHNPIDIYVVGDLDRSRVEDEVREIFELGERREIRKLRGTTPHPPRREPREVVERVDVQQAKLNIGYRSEIRYGDDGFWDLQFMNGVLGGFTHSKLFRNVREKARLCYYASSHLERTKGLVFISSGIEPDTYEQAREVIEEQLEAVRRGDISDEEIENTRRMLHSGYRSLQDGAGRMVGLEYVKFLNGRHETVDQILENIDAVNRDGIVKAANAIYRDTVFLLTSEETTEATKGASS